MDRSLFTLPKVGMVMGILLVFGLAQAACTIGEAYALARSLTNLWEGAAFADQIPFVALFAGCFVGKQVIAFGRETFLARFSHERVEELRSQLLEGVFGGKGNIVGTHGSAAVTQAALEGIHQVEDYLAIILPKIINVIAIPLPLLIAAFLYDWVSGLILLAFFPVIIFFMILLGRQASARAAAQYETYTALSNHFIDTLRGIETLSVFGQAKKYAKRIFGVSEDFRLATIDTLKVATLSSGVLDLIATLGVAAVAIMLGFRLLDGTILLYPSLFALIIAPEFFKPVREFAGDFHASLDGKNALVQITNMISSASEAHEQVALEPWGANSQMKLNGLSYRYPTAKDEEAAEDSDLRALDNVTLSLSGFSKVGIVGVSGSGKSTLVNILGGFIDPTEGTIELDSKTLTGLNQQDWQRQLLYIPQDPYIFHATLRENMCFYSPDATDEQVAEAVKVCGLEQLVSELPQGLDTIIGEGGRGLSGGQAQRIAFARALLDKNRTVLLFDEPTAHLDIETELELKERMLPLMEGRLVFFATHRLHWLSDMDVVVVLEDGRIAEVGTPDELIKAGGKLVRLAQAMNGGGAA